MRNILISALLVQFVCSCNGQDKSVSTQTKHRDSANIILVPYPEVIPLAPKGPYGPETPQVSQYIRRMFQDSKGILWLGTNGDGVCRYNGQGNEKGSLTFLNIAEGLSGSAIRAIAEDKTGNLWFITEGGISRLNNDRRDHPCISATCLHHAELESELEEHRRELKGSFTNFTTKDGLPDNQLWAMLIDKSGRLWFGTNEGVVFYDGKTFTPFPLPAADLSKYPNALPAPKLVNGITQDRKGNIWFATNGNGAYRYDGRSLLNVSEKDGLCNNVVQTIIEDKSGRLWFGTRFGGLSCYNGTGHDGFKPEHFTTYLFNFLVNQGLSPNFIWTIYEDRGANLWLGSAGGGLVKFDGENFKIYTEQDGLTNKFVQSLLEDKDGTFWVGASGGLFRLDRNNNSLVNVKRNGPWPNYKR